MCVCVCVYVRVYAHVYGHACVSPLSFLSLSVSLAVCARAVCVPAHMRLCVYVCVHVRAHCIRVCVYVRVCLRVCACIKSPLSLFEIHLGAFYDERTRISRTQMF